MNWWSTLLTIGQGHCGLTKVVNDVEIIRQNFISLDHLKFGGDQR